MDVAMPETIRLEKPDTPVRTRQQKMEPERLGLVSDTGSGLCCNKILLHGELRYELVHKEEKKHFKILLKRTLLRTGLFRTYIANMSCTILSHNTTHLHYLL